MPILVTCECGRTLRAKAEQAGKRCKCPGCGRVLIVPAPPAPPAPHPPHRGNSVIPPPQVPQEPPAPYSAPDQPLPASPVIAASPAPIPAEPVELDYAGTQVPRTADPLVMGAARPIPVIARPTETIADLDKSWRGRVWWAFVLLMIPLALVTLRARMSIQERINQTMDRLQAKAAASTQPTTLPSFGTADEGYPGLDDALMELPEQKLEGAFLARRSVFPLLFAMVASLGFVFAIAYAIPASSNRPKPVFLAGLFTGTLGVVTLLLIQSSRLICCIPLFYLAALHPDAPFGASLIGFVFGVGVCEEIVKCLPILWMLWRGTLLNWRDAVIIGMASGAGFGISEALLYSFRYYNGIEPADIYIVRFTSSVALHTLLSGACAMMIQRKQEHLVEDLDPLNWIMTLMAIILIPILLHGLFDTLAKKHLEAGSLAVAVGSFIWLAYLIKAARKREQSVATVMAAGPRIVRTAKGTRYVGPP